MWGDGESHCSQPELQFGFPSSQRVSSRSAHHKWRARRGLANKSRLYRKVCDGPTCICLFMIQFLFHPVSLSQNHLKALSLSTRLHLPHTHPLLLYLFSSSSWFNSSIFSFCIPSTKARARWRFPSASVTYWRKNKPKTQKLAMSEVVQSCFKKGQN